MKKIIVILIMILSLGLGSCRYDKSTDYKFISEEEVENKLSSYYATVNLLNVDGSDVTFVMAENSEYYYYDYNGRYYLVEKNANKIYSINHTNKERLLEQKSDFDYIKNKNVLKDFVSKHITTVDSNYKKTTNTVKVGSFDCYSYERNTKVDNSNYIKRTFYVDETSGLCVKEITETCASDNKVVTSWEAKELNFDAAVVNEFINEMLAYEEGLAPIEFDKWPDMGLGLLIPECANGNFMFAVDYGNKAVISIEQIGASDVRTYAMSLVNYGFAEVKNGTNEAAQTTYITYNNDYTMVKIVYTPSRLNLTITISKSTMDDINKELGKL